MKPPSAAAPAECPMEPPGRPARRASVEFAYPTAARTRGARDHRRAPRCRVARRRTAEAFQPPAPLSASSPRPRQIDRRTRSDLRAQLEFLDLPGRRLRQLAEPHRLRNLVCGEQQPAVRDDLLLGRRHSVAQLDERARHLAPLRIRQRDDGRDRDGRMPVQRVLDLDARDVLAARDDDVLAAVLDADVAVGRQHAQVARVEPAARERLVGRMRVLQVALHADVAAEHDLADRLAVGRHGRHRVGIEHRRARLQVVAHALPRVQLRDFVVGQRIPVRLLRADGRGPVYFGEPVHVREVEADLLHFRDHRGRGRRARDERMHFVRDPRAPFGRRVRDRALHDRRAAVMRDALAADQVEHELRVELAQAHVHARARRDRPRKAPAVAVEHRQRPQVDRVLRHVPFEDVADRGQIRAAMVVDDALRIARRPRRVVQRDRIPFVGRQRPRVPRIAAFEECLVVGRAVKTRRVGGHRVGDADDREPRHLERRAVRELREFGVDDQHLRLAVTQHEEHRRDVEPRVQRVEDGARHRHAEVRLDHLRDVRQQRGHCVAAPDARAFERAREPPRARIGLAPRAAHVAVHDGEALAVHLGRARDEIDRRERHVIRIAPAQPLLEPLRHDVVSCKAYASISLVCGPIAQAYSRPL